MNKIIALRNNVPEAVKQCRFCCWRREFRKGKLAKVPYNPITGRKAQTDHPDTFASFDEALTAYTKERKYNGVGILVGEGICAVDIDDCINEDGTLNELAASVLGQLKDCYFEVSPSGTGLRGFFKVSEPYDKDRYYIKHGDLELYIPGMTNRFVTVTGDVYRDGGVEDETEGLKAVLDQHLQRNSAMTMLPDDFEPHSFLSDAEVLVKARREKKFSDCFDGEWHSYFPSQPEADLFVMGVLAFYCGGDMEQMERLFYDSGLSREKFSNEYGLTAYAERTMKMAVASRQSFYDPAHGRTPAAEDFAEAEQAVTDTGMDSGPAGKDDGDHLDTQLDTLLSSSPTISDLYDRHNLILAAYAKVTRPADYETLRSLAKANGMQLRRYEKEISSHVAEAEKRRKERMWKQKEQELSAHGSIPDFIYFSRAAERLVVNPTKLAIHVKEHLPFILVQDSLRDTRTKYVYEDGVYHLCSDERFKGYIKSFIEDFDATLVRMGDVDEAFRNLSVGLTAIPYDQLNADEDIINFKNGLLHLSTMELTPHDPDVLSTIQLDCEWSGVKTPAPVFDSYMRTLADNNRDVQRLLLQFMGAALSNVHGWRYKKALFLYGEGDTGKSVVKVLLERLLGRNNFASIDLPELETQFGASMIYGKRLAGTANMTFMTVRELKMFKTITGGDNIKVEFKGKTGFSYVYDGLLLFCMNQKPRFGGDDGDWVFRRIMQVECPNVIPDAKQDHELVDKLYGERAGILYKSIMALKETIAAGYRFSEPESVTRARNEYKAENNSVIQFIQDCMVHRRIIGSISKCDYTTISSVHRIYMKWCKYNNNGYAKTLKEFKKTYAEYVGVSLDDAFVRRGQGVYCKYHEITEEAYTNLLPSDFEVHRDHVMGKAV